MNDIISIDKLTQKIKDYARGRSQDVARGAETPRLAALLLQKYGLGLLDAAAVIYDNPRMADPISLVLDEETAKIDPQWREHNQERWAGRPADVVSKTIKPE